METEGSLLPTQQPASCPYPSMQSTPPNICHIKSMRPVGFEPTITAGDADLRLRPRGYWDRPNQLPDKLKSKRLLMPIGYLKHIPEVPCKSNPLKGLDTPRGFQEA